MDSNNWVTPPQVINYIERVLGVKFVLDLCASDNFVAAAPKYYTPELDGLKQPWFIEGIPAEIQPQPAIWLNPPYGRGLVNEWTARAAHHAMNGLLRQPIVALLPNATDTQWFHEGVLLPVAAGAASLIWIEGRIDFLNPETMKPEGTGKRGNVLVIYGGESKVRTLRAKDMEANPNSYLAAKVTPFAPTPGMSGAVVNN